MKKIILLTLIIGIFLLSFTSAAISRLPKPVKMNDCVRLPQTCPDCTYNNISTILYPNLSIAVEGIGMSKNGTEYNYTFCLTGELGEYIVNGYGDTGGTLTTWNYPFDVTPNGLPIPTAGESILYFTFMIILFSILIIMVYFICVLPSGNDKVDGVVMGIVKLKYLRIFLIAMCYPATVITLNLLNGLASNFVSLTIFSGIIGFLFEVLLRAAWIFTIIIIIWIIYLLVQDSNFKKLIKKMGEPI